MRILVIGGGGREHAMVWKLAESADIGAAPGNPGIGERAWTAPDAQSIEAYVDVAEHYSVDLTVVGPEAPLVGGIVDRFRAEGQRIVGPTASAARLEGSKAFSKDFMRRHSIPTARFVTVNNEVDARRETAQFDLPVVLKADGLAAGKGVIVAQTQRELDEAIPTLLNSGNVVIEEFLDGEEVSFIVMTDGKDAVPFPASQDHKAAYDGDRGPNTGGMGAYSDDRILTKAAESDIMERVIMPVLHGMRAERTPFTGFLYAGLMVTNQGVKVLEFNARMGDPETQVLLHRTRSDFAELLRRTAEGTLKGATIDTTPDPSICVVLASHGYPGTIRTGDAITGIEEAETSGAVVFHAGTKRDGSRLETAGGRVLGVTASGPDLAVARENVYAAVSHVYFDGMHYRKDIGHRGLKRYNNK